MTRKAALKPRKLPQKQGSEQTVEAILQATARLLERRGHGRLTTNHIAETAGVSIGSLYQYFPNKDAICHALSERHHRQHADLYIRRLEEVATLPVEDQVRAMVRVNYEIARASPVLSRNLYVELARIGGMDPLRAMRERIEAALTARYASLPAALRPARPEMVAFIVTVACSQLLGDAVVRRPEWLDDEHYLEQVSGLILGYYSRLGWL